MIRLVGGKGQPEPPIEAIHLAVSHLADCSTEQLRERSLELGARSGSDTCAEAAREVQAMGLAYEALRRTLGFTLYDVQLRAAWVLSRGRVAEMQTGEGKTLACAVAAYVHALAGRGVVATPNSYLAERDFELLAPAFRQLGLSVGLLPERGVNASKRAAYLCDITYGTGYEFGFDYLRDELARRQVSNCVLGEQLWAQLQDRRGDMPAATQRPLYCAIVDEVDNVLLDDAGSPLVISAPVGEEAADAVAHRAACRTLELLVEGRHYQVDRSVGVVRLTDAGVHRIHAADVTVPIEVLKRTWTEHVEMALAAELLFRCDVHYIVRDGSVQIVDASTGRIFSERVWQDGLHQAIEAKEGLVITAERPALAQITRQRYYRLYPRLCGTTGTATGCEREFRHVYGLTVQSIPSRLPSRLALLPARFFATATAKWQAIVESVRHCRNARRAVLIGTRSIDDSERLAQCLLQQGITCQLLNGVQDAQEAAIIARAGQAGAVTIATNLAGRGTDIRLAPETAFRGGLHVVVTDCHDSSRVDRQLIGRTARQGAPGTAQVFVSADDSLLQRHGPWLAEYLRRHAGPDGEVPFDLSPHVRRLQALAQRRDFAARTELLRRDRAREMLFSRI